jgi:heat shock protein HtpX
MLDASQRRAHKLRNAIHSLVLVGGLTIVTAFSAWLLWSWPGVIITLVSVLGLYLFAPSVPPEVVMRMYRAVKRDPRRGDQITQIVADLSQRAELAAVPEIYVIPSTTLNAFATGRPDKAVIGITDGLLRRLDTNELAGVLAHEISHVRNNDLAVMSLADVMTRFTQMLSYLALFLAFFNLPAILAGQADLSLLGLVLLYLAPSIGSLLQLGLSRTREHDADLEGAYLTGNPRALASALQKLERYQGRFWEDLAFPVPGRRIPQPSLLRSHPTTEERIERLRALEGQPMLPPIEVAPEPVVALAGAAAMRPRTRWPGVWY